MDYRQDFTRIMSETSDIALATVKADGTTNVRIINYLWDEDAKTVYFSTFKGTAKIEEIAANGKVSFITIPVGNRAFVRADATARPSTKSVDEMKEAFIAKYPFFAQMFAMGTDKFVLYELAFDNAHVNLEFGKFGEVTV
jgi:general stress protein 26